MQRLSMEQLNNMTGLEYILLHVQEPILFVIRKQHRHSSTQVTPLADYYIIAGVVYQAPDLSSVVNSRLLNSINHLQSAFNECLSYTRYHPSKGYSWEFKDKDAVDQKVVDKKKEKKEEPSSIFQRQRVDMLLMEVSRKFPLKTAGMGQTTSTSQLQNQPLPSQSQPQSEQGQQNQQKQVPSPSTSDSQQMKVEVKVEPGTTPAATSVKDKSDDLTNSGPLTPQQQSQQQQQQQQRIKPPPEKRQKLS